MDILLAEKIQGTPARTRKPRRRLNTEIRWLAATPRPKTLSLEARMKDPIMQVNVFTGEVLVDRIREYWAREK